MSDVKESKLNDLVFDENEVYKICHKDGSEWTEQELKEFAKNLNKYVLEKKIPFDFDGGYEIYVDSDLKCIIKDDYNRTIPLEGLDFYIAWNKEWCEKYMKDSYCSYRKEYFRGHPVI